MNLLYEENRECTACKLREFCKAPVPAMGYEHAQVMLVGEGPGENEDLLGKPFQGQAGQILRQFLHSIDLTPEDCWITNTVKCRPPGNRDPEPDEIDTCGPMWLQREIEMVNPRIICALGAYAARYLTGDPDLTMEKDHGIPRLVDGRIVLPMYHPAAGLHQSKLMRFVQDDFNVLQEILRGTDYTEFIPVDEYPNPEYIEVTSVEEAERLLSLPLFALDTETIEVDGRSELWSIQITDKAGMGYFIPISLWNQGNSCRHARQLGIHIPPTSRVIVHNYLYDALFIDIPNPIDTMVAAWLLQIPMGLKTLAYIFCGMEMHDYMEYVKPHRRNVALEYLHHAASFIEEIEVPANPKAKNPKKFKTAYTGWPDPPVIEDWEWDNKAGELVKKVKHPHNIITKIQERIKKSEDPEYDVYHKWYDIDERERSVVEERIGVMRDAGLHDAPREEAVYYASRDPDATWRVGEKLIPMLREQKLVDVFKMEMNMLPVVLEMMQNGMAVDVEKLNVLSAECIRLMQEEAKKCKHIAGYGFNPNSHDQVRQLVYEELEFEVTKRTKKSREASTDDKQLSKVDHPVIKPILEYRKILKVRSSYAEKLPKYVDYSDLDTTEYGIVYPTIRLAGTDTGRLKVSDPPLQTIPVRTELGKRVRAAFRARNGKILLFVDLSQIEMRILAHVARCAGLIQLFIDGGDIHTDTAVRLFGVDRETAREDKYRKPIKNVNFGVVYGISPQGLYDLMIENEVTGWTLEDCAQLIKDYFKLYPEIETYSKHVIASAYQTGYAEDMFGRRRYIPELQSPMKWIQAEGERMAGNMPIQSGAQGYFKMGTYKFWKERNRQHMPVDMLMQIHDELVNEVDDGDELPAAWCMVDALCTAMPLSVPILAEAKAGYNWADAKELVI